MCRDICVRESLPLRRAGGTLLAMGVWGMAVAGSVAAVAIGRLSISATREEVIDWRDSIFHGRVEHSSATGGIVEK